MLLRDYGTTGLMEERKVEKVSNKRRQPGVVAESNICNGSVYYINESAKHD